MRGERGVSLNRGWPITLTLTERRLIFTDVELELISTQCGRSSSLFCLCTDLNIHRKSAQHSHQVVPSKLYTAGGAVNSFVTFHALGTIRSQSGEVYHSTDLNMHWAIKLLSSKLHLLVVSHCLLYKGTLLPGRCNQPPWTDSISSYWRLVTFSVLARGRTS